MPPELFEMDGVSGLTLVGNTIYWHTNCGELYSPARSRLRSNPAAGGLR